MPSDNKLLEIAKFTQHLSTFLNVELADKVVYRSKGLLAHILKQKHFTAAKYLDYLNEIIINPDYAGKNGDSIELVKKFKDNIFVSINLDISKDMYYVSTMFDVKMSKIESYCKSGRLKKCKLD